MLRRIVGGRGFHAGPGCVRRKRWNHGICQMPQPHSSCSHTAILARRRILEDKAVATLDGITFSCACLCVCVCVCALLFSVCLCARVFFCDLRGFDVNEVSLNFSDNVLGNDRRKTSQQCYWVKHYATSFRPATDASEVLCVAI